jgi:hypothetical protein
MRSFVTSAHQCVVCACVLFISCCKGTYIHVQVLCMS